MLPAFTEDAQRAIALAHEDAVERGHAMVGTGHILRGLLRHEEAQAAGALRSLGVTRGAWGALRTALRLRAEPRSCHARLHHRGDAGAGACRA